MTISSGRMPDGTVCNHEGETSTYCTRCWTNLYEAQPPRENLPPALDPSGQTSFEAKYLGPPGTLLTLVGLYYLFQPAAPGTGIVNLHRLAIGVALTVGGFVMLAASRMELFVSRQRSAREKASTPMPASGEASDTTPEERLRTLDDLREKGLLTEEEYRLKHEAIVRAL